MRSLPSQSEPLLQPDGKARIPWYGWFDELWRKLRGLWSVDDGQILFMDGTTIGGATVGEGLTLNRTTNTLSASTGTAFPEAPQDGAIYGRRNAAWTVAGGLPAPPNQSIQFNNAGAFGGDSDLIWDQSNDLMTINGSVFFEGARRRIYISGAYGSTTADRFIIQSGDANLSTLLDLMPNGTATSAGLGLANNSDPATAGYLSIGALSDQATIAISLQGSAPTIPFYIEQTPSSGGAGARIGFTLFPSNNTQLGDYLTTSPPSDSGYRLKVDGTMYVSGAVDFAGAINLGGSTGTSGYVLTSQGASPPIWSPVSISVSAESRLIGRGEGGGAGASEEITLGTGLVMSGTTLSSSGGAVPWFVPSGETATISEYSQASFIIPIDVEGTLDVSGYLIEVTG